MEEGPTTASTMMPFSDDTCSIHNFESLNKYIPSISLASIIPCGLQESISLSLGCRTRLSSAFAVDFPSLTTSSKRVPVRRDTRFKNLLSIKGELCRIMASVRNSFFDSRDYVIKASLSGSRFRPKIIRKPSETNIRGGPIFVSSNIDIGDICG